MVLYKARDCYIRRKIAGDDFLVPVGQQAKNKNGIVLLNGTAAFLWEQLSEPRSVPELCAALAEEYELNGEDVTEDVLSFIEYMRSLEAIETSVGETQNR